MTRDIILNTTVEIIRASERNLQLAFQVEKALPEVRTELIKEFFKCVEKQLKQKVEAAEGWEIRATGTEGLWMRKKSWVRLKVGEDDWWGIYLFQDEKNDPYIGVASIKKTSKEEKEQIREQFRNFMGAPETQGAEIYHSLEDDLSDMNGLDFLEKMVNDGAREKIVKNMADKLHKLADAVDRVLSNSG